MMNPSRLEFQWRRPIIFFLMNYYHKRLCVSAVVTASLTESTLKTVPQVVNVQELKDKGPAAQVFNIMR